MRTLLLFISISFFGIIVRAQHNHFVYLQTDNKQAFYVKLNEKVYSSSASGYLVIPKLQNGSHKFTVGFPKNEWPNQEIALPVVNKDQGYILKNFDSKGWGLFNMQTLDVIMASSNSSSSETAQVATRTDEFSNTLADVVNTPSIKELKKEETVKVAEPAKPVQAPVEPGPLKPVAEAKAVDSAKPAADSRVDTTAVSPSLSSAPARADSTATASIRRMNETHTEEGTVVNYLVKNDSHTDTVQVILPRDEVVADKEEIKDLPKEVKPVEAAAPKETKVPDTAAPKFIDIELNNPNSAKDTAVRQLAEAEKKATAGEKVSDAETVQPTKAPAPVASTELKMINSDCKSSASEEDFLKVRKKMIAQKDENEMISAAQKLFKQKCYSTDQVKNLSVLFLKDESKYKFFDAAYPFVYDTPNFKNLESQLTDPYFISRFKAMIRN